MSKWSVKAKVCSTYHQVSINVATTARVCYEFRGFAFFSVHFLTVHFPIHLTSTRYFYVSPI